MRNRLLMACLGAQGTGKTTVARTLVANAIARGERVRILDPEGNFPRQADPFPGDVESWLDERLTRADCSLLVFDDFDRYVPKVPSRDSAWRKLWLTNRHVMRKQGVDVLVTGRRPQNLPMELASGIDFLYLFALSRTDRPGIRRIEEIAPGIALPSEPYRFVRVEPKTLDGCHRPGRTLPGGGYRFDR